MSNLPANFDPTQICFGWDRGRDEQSLALFLRLLSREEFLQTLIPRLADEDIIQIVDSITGILQKHLQEEEYHELFLCEKEGKFSA